MLEWQSPTASHPRRGAGHPRIDPWRSTLLLYSGLSRFRCQAIKSLRSSAPGWGNITIRGPPHPYTPYKAKCIIVRTEHKANISPTNHAINIIQYIQYIQPIQGHMWPGLRKSTHTRPYVTGPTKINHVRPYGCGHITRHTWPFSLISFVLNTPSHLHKEKYLLFWIHHPISIRSRRKPSSDRFGCSSISSYYVMIQQTR